MWKDRNTAGISGSWVRRSGEEEKIKMAPIKSYVWINQKGYWRTKHEWLPVGNQDWRLTWVNKHLVPSRSIHPSIRLSSRAYPGSALRILRLILGILMLPRARWFPMNFLVSTLQEVFTVVKTWQESINKYTNTTWLFLLLGCTLKTWTDVRQMPPQILDSQTESAPHCEPSPAPYPQRTCLACKENSHFGSSTFLLRSSPGDSLRSTAEGLPQRPDELPRCPAEDKQLVHCPRAFRESGIRGSTVSSGLEICVACVDCSVLLC